MTYSRPYEPPRVPKFDNWVGEIRQRMAEPIIDSLLLRLLIIAFGIGALIGLEREQAESGGTFAGSRTFPLFALIGAIVQAFFPELLPVTVLAIALPLTVAYAGKILTEGDVGLTTLTAAILTVLLGALAAPPERALFAIVVGGSSPSSSAKPTIHGLVDQIDEHERRASLKFILVVFVVLPISCPTVSSTSCTD